jgi:quercetin dioxygenase-like cupin family protein
MSAGGQAIADSTTKEPIAYSPADITSSFTWSADLTLKDGKFVRQGEKAAVDGDLTSRTSSALHRLSADTTAEFGLRAETWSVFVVAGELTLALASTTRPLGAGSFATIPASVGGAIGCGSGSECTYLVVQSRRQRPGVDFVELVLHPDDVSSTSIKWVSVKEGLGATIAPGVALRRLPAGTTVSSRTRSSKQYLFVMAGPVAMVANGRPPKTMVPGSFAVLPPNIGQAITCGPGECLYIEKEAEPKLPEGTVTLQAATQEPKRRDMPNVVGLTRGAAEVALNVHQIAFTYADGPAKAPECIVSQSARGSVVVLKTATCDALNRRR